MLSLDCVADETRDRQNTLLYLGNSGKTIGVTFLAWHNGFAPDDRLPADLQGRFDDSIPHPENNPLNLDLSGRPEDVASIGALSHLRWVKYCGGTSRIVPRVEINKRESARILEFEESIRKLKHLRSIAFYDAPLPPGLLERLMKHESIEIILLIGCFTVDEAGQFSRTPNARILINQQ